LRGQVSKPLAQGGGSGTGRRIVLPGKSSHASFKKVVWEIIVSCNFFRETALHFVFANFLSCWACIMDQLWGGVCTDYDQYE
jgi:hypothetical protein